MCCEAAIYELSLPHNFIRLETIPSSVFVTLIQSIFITNFICAWEFLYLNSSNLEIGSPILLQLGYLNWQSSFGLFHFKIWWMICSQNSDFSSYFLHFVYDNHLKVAHRQSRTYQQWRIFAIPCKKVKEKGKSLCLVFD